MSVKTFKMLDASGIEAAIASILKNGKKLDGDIQQAAVSCLDHIEKHGDVRLFNRLYLAMPKGARKSALTAWGIAFGKIEANSGENKKEQPFVYAKDKTTNLPLAIAEPWFNFSPDKAPDEVFDVVKALKSLLARAGKANAVNNPELLAALRDIEPVDA